LIFKHGNLQPQDALKISKDCYGVQTADDRLRPVDSADLRRMEYLAAAKANVSRPWEGTKRNITAPIWRRAEPAM
jgi:hypothetical protein